MPPSPKQGPGGASSDLSSPLWGRQTTAVSDRLSVVPLLHLWFGSTLTRQPHDGPEEFEAPPGSGSTPRALCQDAIPESDFRPQ
jgi:hypothetical protein